MKPIFLWKRVSLAQRDRLPSKSGLYAVVSLGRVFYVGLSENLEHRWRGKNHHRLPQAEDLLWPYLHYIELPKARIRAAETKLIKRVKPPWNNTRVPKRKWAFGELVSIGLMIALAIVVWSKYGENAVNWLTYHGPVGEMLGRFGE